MKASEADQEPIAIIAMGGLFPGARDLDNFWQNIASGIDATRDVPRSRWTLSPVDVVAQGGTKPDKALSKRGCFLDNIDFDIDGLSIEPNLVQQLDPLFGLTLAAGKQAWTSASSTSLDPRRVGVILGNIVLPTVASSEIADELFHRVYEKTIFGKRQSQQTKLSRHGFDRYVAGLPGGLLARALGIGGGSMTLDAACASSLYAIALAIRELRARRADAMLAGGVSRPDPLYTQMGFSQLHALSPTGRCAPFDVSANGLVVGEGAGIVLLKRLSDAVRDCDPIHGVIADVALSNDVDGNLLQPSSEGQLRALRAAYARSGWRPSEVELIECHGTGTPVGDAVELSSLRDLWKDESYKNQQCVIGSVKSNVGHLLTGAGAAGLIKVLLALRHQTLPPTANFSSPNPRLSIEQSPFTVLSEARAWETKGNARRAAINAFGFGGINAHLLLEEWNPSASTQVRGSDVEKPHVPIAVIGMDARFGPLGSLRELERCVLGGESIEPTLAPDRWRGVQAMDAEVTKIPVFALPDLQIPKDRFRIPPRELGEILPQQLLMLDVATRALEQSGLKADREARKRFGVFVGIGLDLNTTNFHFRWSLLEKARFWGKELGLSDSEIETWASGLREGAGPPLSANRTMGALGGIVASRVARELRVGGPSFTISSEETSGLKALEAAVRSLQAGEIDVAIVGAVDINSDGRSLYATDADRPYSRSGACRPFDQNADGTVPGEGAAAIILRRLEDAQQGGDEIHAILRGIGSSSSRSGTFPAGDVDGYATACKRAHRDAGIHPESIGYVETHGSGTPEEDTVEIAALAQLFGNTDKRCALGSVKPAIGHAGAAAGLASLIKATLCLKQKILPPLHGAENPLADLARFLVPKQPSYWLRNRAEGPRRAGVSAVSIDGTCVHVVLEEGPQSESAFASLPIGLETEFIFLLPGSDVREVLKSLDALQAFIDISPKLSLNELANAWWRRHPHRILSRVSIVTRSVSHLRTCLAEARESLRLDPDKASPPPSSRGGWYYSPRPLAKEGEIAFVFPGSGSHFLGMGRDIAATWPLLLERQDAESSWLKQQLLPEAYWHAESLADAEGDLRKLILGQVALGTLVSDAVRQFGVEPNAVIGYSLGESAGLFSLRAWRDRDEMWKRVWESTLFTEDLTGPCKAARQQLNLRDDEPFEWQVGVIDRPAKVIEEHLAVGSYLLLVNTDRECVIGGERQAVNRLVKEIGGSFVPLRGVTTVHCHLAEPVKKAYRDLHLLPTTPPEGARFYGGAWAKAYELSSDTAADSIVAGALGVIDFPALIRQAYDDGVRIFIEMGPGNSCTRMLHQILEGKAYFAKAACPQNGSAVSAIIHLLAGLAAEGVPVDLRRLYGAEQEIQQPVDQSNVVTIPIAPPPLSIPAPPNRQPVTVAEPSSTPMHRLLKFPRLGQKIPLA